MRLVTHLARIAIVVAVATYVDFQMSGPHLSVIGPAAVVIASGLMSYQSK